MTIEVEPLSREVKGAVRRHTSPCRHLPPFLGKILHWIMFALVCGGCVAGIGLLWHTALGDRRFLLDGETLGLGGSVRQCPESIGELAAIGHQFSGRSLLDPFLVTDLQTAYETSVWVRRVSRMRRSFPNRVDLELQLRLPAAQVKSGRRYWMIDGDGLLLPVAGNAEPFPGLPEIVGVASNTIGNRPDAGEAWVDEGVAGGLGILRVFWGSPLSEALPVQRVVVNTGVFESGGKVREVRRRFDVVTTSGMVIRWGTYNDVQAPGDELTSAEKMWNLQDLLSRDEALRPGVCLDVRTRLPGFSLTQ